MADQPPTATGTPHPNLASTSQPPVGEPTSGFHPTHYEGARYHDHAINHDFYYGPPHRNSNQFGSTSTGPNYHGQFNYNHAQPHHSYDGYSHPMYREDSIPTAIPSYLRTHPNPNYPSDFRAASPARNHWVKDSNGQYRYQHEEAYIQEVESDADLADLEDLPPPPIPTDAAPPPPPAHRARELTPHPSDFGPTAPNSPETPGFFSRRRTESSGSLLRSGPASPRSAFGPHSWRRTESSMGSILNSRAASPRPTLDPQTATAQLADMLDQPQEQNDAARTSSGPTRLNRDVREHSSTPPTSPGQSQSWRNPAPGRRWANSRLPSSRFASPNAAQRSNVPESSSVPLHQPMGPGPPPNLPQSAALPSESDPTARAQAPPLRQPMGPAPPPNQPGSGARPGRTAWARTSQAPPGVAPIQQFPATGYNTYPAEHLPPTAPVHEQRPPVTAQPTLLNPETPREAQHEAQPLGNNPTVMLYPDDERVLPPLTSFGAAFPALDSLSSEPNPQPQHQPAMPHQASDDGLVQPSQSPRGPATFGPNGNTLPPRPSFATGYPTIDTLASEPPAPQQHRPMTPENAQRRSRYPPRGQRAPSPPRQSEAGPSRRPHMEETRSRQQNGKGKGRAEPAPALGVPRYQSTPPPAQQTPLADDRMPDLPWQVLDRCIVMIEGTLVNVDWLAGHFARTSEDDNPNNPNAMMARRVKEVTVSLKGDLLKHQAITSWEQRFLTERWRQKNADRTLQGFSRFTDTVYDRTALRTPSIGTLSKCSAKLTEFETKFIDLRAKFTSLYNRIRLRQLHRDLWRATNIAADKLRQARYARDLHEWNADKEERARLRRAYLDFRDHINRARRTSLRS
ncbi:hypothetical protein DXG03_008245 [Asterophora parasitica]|uniref:Uncharacterized protein n=1 Tax=Asterophora parasitica TaxID=117018 RepID=A0A9P7KBG1_9AGAR|nr:hypothetical protein DXG03_008245 [Asterophora parasitica]